MKIDFNDIPEKVLPHFQGGEKEFHARMFVDEHNKIMRATLIPGATIGMHCHETSSEILVITSGEGQVVYDGDIIPLKAGDCHYCPKGHSHSLMNTSDADLSFFAVVPQQ